MRSESTDLTTIINHRRLSHSGSSGYWPLFFQLQEFIHFHHVVLSSKLNVRVDLTLTKTAILRITLKLDGVPMTSKSHTHPSHSQTSRLLTSSLYLGVPVPRTLGENSCLIPMIPFLFGGTGIEPVEFDLWSEKKSHCTFLPLDSRNQESLDSWNLTKFITKLKVPISITEIHIIRQDCIWQYYTGLVRKETGGGHGSLWQHYSEDD